MPGLPCAVPCSVKSISISEKQEGGELDAPASAGPLSFRIATKYSLSENSGGGFLKIGRQDQHASAISTSNAETIVVRGRNLTQDLMGKVSFTELIWLLVTGAMPSAAQRTVLDSTLVAIA